MTDLCTASYLLSKKLREGSGPNWLVSVGFSNELSQIVVYASKVRDAKKAIPAEYKGYPVIVKKR